MPFLGLDLVLLHLHLGLRVDMMSYFDLFELQWLVLHVDFLLERSPADLISVLFQHISRFLLTINSNTVLILKIFVIIVIILDRVNDRLLKSTASCIARHHLLLFVFLFTILDTLRGRLHAYKVARGALLVVTARLHHEILNFRDTLLRHFLPLVEVLLPITIL